MCFLAISHQYSPQESFQATDCFSIQTVCPLVEDEWCLSVTFDKRRIECCSSWGSNSQTLDNDNLRHYRLSYHCSASCKMVVNTSCNKIRLQPFCMKSTIKLCFYFKMDALYSDSPIVCQDQVLACILTYEWNTYRKLFRILLGKKILPCMLTLSFIEDKMGESPFPDLILWPSL